MTKMLPVLKSDVDKFCLKWDRFHENVISMFDHLRQNEKLVDVTLCSESQKVKVHRLTMSACSPYLRDLLKDNPCEHPVIVLTDTTAFDLNAIVEFMYKGAIDVPHSELKSFMKTLEMLQIEGIGSIEDKAPPAPVATRLSSCRPAAAEASTSEQRSTHHEPHRSSPRPTKRRHSSVQESSSVPRTASPSPPPSTISPSPPKPDSMTDSDLNDLEAPDCESPAVDPLCCPESEEQLLALEKQMGESAALVKTEERDIEIEENSVGVDGTLSYDTEFDMGCMDNEVSVGNSTNADVDFLPHVDVKPDSCYQTADEESFNDEKADVSDPVCTNVRTARICCDESSHDEDRNGETSGDIAEEGRFGKDKAQEGGRYQPRRSTRVGQTDTTSRQWLEWESGPTCASHCHCQQCNYVCISKAQLDRHILVCHAARKGKHKCQWCDYATDVLCNLKRHRCFHTEPYSCYVCGKAVKTSLGLIIHNRPHTGVRPYTCNVCDKAFLQLENFITHKRTHTSERPYTCNVCGKTFVESGHLISHKRIHFGKRPYTCNVCDKTFVRQGTLIMHKRTHAGERLYTCNVCDKTFVQQGALIIHKRTHTGKRPYTCNVCENAFLQRAHLIRHQRTHTSDLQ